VEGKPVKERLQEVQYFLIDELSSLGCYMNGFISERLRAIKGVNDFYGGANVILFGDFSQLLSIGNID
jgi:hypothetical protein